MPTTTPAQRARALHRVIEPLHTVTYFADEAQAAWEELGLEPRAQGYVAGRSAPLGRVGAAAVSAVFFNFNPALPAAVLPDVWDTVTPDQVLGARAAAIEAVFARAVPDDGVAEATELARTAAAAADLAGRPLGAATAALSLPGTPYADLWQLLTTLREHRGDGHVALLTSSGLSPVEVLVVYSAWQQHVSRRFLQRSRLWDEDAWAGAEARLRDRGWIDDDGALTDAGRDWRDGVEADTDRLASAPYAALGEDASRRLFELLLPMAVALDAADGIFPRPANLPADFDDATATPA